MRIPKMCSRLATSITGLFWLVCAVDAQGQETDEQRVPYDEPIEEIVVTGSRIKRDTFATTTPIQILNTEDAQRIGILNVSELLQKSTVSSGEQIDASFNSNAGNPLATEAPPDGGVGSSCVNLRGFGCERALVLVNGKRLGLGGIRGAPSQPDINMLPIGMVEAVDVLTGGLTTIYGADAVAGVVNVRMKEDFEGINLTVASDLPEHPGGETFAASMTAGLTGDAGSFMIGMEYSEQARVTAADRNYAYCNHHGAINITEDGQTVAACRSDNPDNWVVPFGNVFEEFGWTQVGGAGPVPHPVDAARLIYTPGTSNILDANGNPVTGFSTFAVLPDAAQDGLRGFPNPIRPFYLDRFRYADATGTHDGWNDQYDRRQADLWRPYQRFSLVTHGTLDLDWGNSEEAYFEGYYFNRTNGVRAATEQIIPTILGQVPLVDATNTQILDDNGAMIMVDNPLNPFPVDVQLVLTLSDVPQTFDTELQQIRLVTGLTGDLPFSENWSYDVAVTYDRATGFVKQPILIEPHLFFATQSIGVVADANGNPTSQVVCGPRQSDFDFFLTMGGCVPADLLNMSVVGDGVTHSGRFATQAERDYLVANRTNRTLMELFTFQAYATGDLFEIPGGGMARAAFGIEYRVDTIDSQHGAVGVLGLNAAINDLVEGETIGERDTFDVYAEVSLPLFIDKGAADLFQVDLAVRFTDDEYFGGDAVYKVGYLWDINEYVSWSSSFNTSFRAPNLREGFLADFTGELSVLTDPCRQMFVDELEDSPTKDILLNNCALSGADVTVLGSAAAGFIPMSAGGNLDLNPETSESLTSTITLSLPQWASFNFDVALTYFDIKIEDTVRELGPGEIISRCFFERPNLESAFCNRVERNRPNAPPESNFLSFVRAGFINTGKESVTGYDLMTRLSFDVAGADVAWTTGSSFLKERLTQEFPPSPDDADGSPIVDNVGRIGNPEITFQSTVDVALNNWDFVWQARWWDDTQFPQGIVNPVITDVDGRIIGGMHDAMTCDEAFGDDGCADFGYRNSSQFDTDTLGPIRPITEARGQMHHDLSVSYNADEWSLTAGINNVFDKEPPLIGQDAGPNRNNAITSAAYDNVGRSYFARFSVSF